MTSEQEARETELAKEFKVGDRVRRRRGDQSVGEVVEIGFPAPYSISVEWPTTLGEKTTYKLKGAVYTGAGISTSRPPS